MKEKIIFEKLICHINIHGNLNYFFPNIFNRNSDPVQY